MALFEDTLADTVSTSELTPVGRSVDLTQALGVVDALFDPDIAYSLLLSDSVTITPAAAAAYGLVVAEMADLTAAAGPTTTYQVTLARAMAIVDAAAAGEAVTAADAMTVADVASMAFSKQILDALGISSVLDPSTTYSKTLTTSFVITDALRRFLDGVATDTVEMTSTLLPMAKTYPVLTDTTDITPALTPALLLRVTTTDGVSLTDAEALNLIYKQIVSDSFSVTAAYLSPGEALTTWAVNTINGAVTEYDNYDFNSFATVGGEYFGASATGLYKLTGDDDVGTSIVARIKSGLLQMTEARFTQFRAAYLASRTDAEGAQQFVLKLVTGDGTERTYGVVVRNNETTKIHLGKGLRARYFSFELTSTGQDFDLDTLEFVPITASRRV